MLGYAHKSTLRKRKSESLLATLRISLLAASTALKMRSVLVVLLAALLFISLCCDAIKVNV